MNLSILSFQKDIDCTLINRQGETLGEIEDWIIDAQGGEITACIASVGGFLGIGQRNVILPKNSLQFNMARNQYIFLPVSDRLKEAPEIAYTSSGELDGQALKNSRKYFA